MASRNRISGRRPPTFGGSVVNLFAAEVPPGAGRSAHRGPEPTFTARAHPTNRVWAIERVGPPPDSNAPDQLAKIALLWADATMLVLAALGAALIVAALVL